MSAVEYFIIYDDATGEIVNLGKASVGSIGDPRAGRTKITNPDPDNITDETHYIVGGVPTVRPSMGLTIGPTTVGLNTNVNITGLPNPTTVRHPGGEAVITDGILDWQSSEPGNYQLVLTSFPYVEERINVTVEL